jgi:hypothetical protein
MTWNFWWKIPPTSDDAGVERTRDEIPCIVGEQGLILFHIVSLVWIDDSVARFSEWARGPSE